MRFLKLVLIGVLAVFFNSCGDTSTQEKVATTVIDETQQEVVGKKLPSKVTQSDYTNAKCYNSVVTQLGGKCRYVKVKAEPDNPNSTRTLDVYYSVVPARDQANKKEPIVFLIGGPGSSITHYIHYMFRPGAPHAMVNQTHDYIFIDYRGVGFSQPYPLCAGVKDKKHLVEYINNCVKRLNTSPVINTGDYTSHNNAYDVTQILKQEGIIKANLVGISYGTRVASTIIRDYPEVVNKVVMDGFFPIEVNGITQAKESILDKLEILAKKYNKDYPDEDFKARLEEFTQEVPSTGMLMSIARLAYDDNGTVRAKYNFDSLNKAKEKEAQESKRYIKEMSTDINPSALADVSRGLNSPIDPAYAHLDFSEMMAFSIIIYEEFAFADEQKPFTFGFGKTVVDVLDGFTGGAPADISALGEFNINTRIPEDKEMQPIVSSKPILILAGGQDFQTPLYWSKNAQKHLSNSKIFLFKKEGHAFSTGSHHGANKDVGELLNNFFDTDDINSLSTKNENFELVE